MSDKKRKRCENWKKNLLTTRAFLFSKKFGTIANDETDKKFYRVVQLKLLEILLLQDEIFTSKQDLLRHKTIIYLII